MINFNYAEKNDCKYSNLSSINGVFSQIKVLAHIHFLLATLQLTTSA